MATCALDLPINVPWKLIAASADMMDTRFCNKLFPFAWRSSLALSAYEPGPTDVPDNLCGQQLTYLKVTCSITGYQPSKDETGQIVDYFGGDPTEDQRAILDQILAEYFACYGVLLNVAVFPGPRAVYKEFPIDFAGLPETRPGSMLPNPYDVNGVKFVADGVAQNRLVDNFPSGGDGQLELDLANKMTIMLPTNVTIGMVAADVAHFSASGVTMEAFKAGVSLGSVSSGPVQNTVHTLELVGDGIDSVVLTAPDDHASLLKFTYGLPAGESTDTQGIALDDFPHIVDFEPKVRDLYQAATDTGEILSDSKSGVKTDKSFTHTHSTENSLSLGIQAPLGDSGLVGKAGTSLANTDTDQSQWAVQADSSRERRETQSTSTQISQMYNLLTGYHVGTNRALFLMLARPHVLQPTDFRTFVQGLRAIEGVQEFFLIVSRPQDMDGVCVETWLETGHFPEDTPIIQPTPQYDESSEDFPVTKSANGGFFSSDCADIDTDYTVAGGWVIDRRPERGCDPGHPGIAMLQDRSNSQATSSLHNYNYLPTSDATVSVTGRICGGTGFGADDANFDRTYRVFTRSEQPKPTDQEPSAALDRLVITARQLCVCFHSKDGCPEVLPQPQRGAQQDRSIVAEPVISISPGLLTVDARAASRTPAMKAFLRRVERSMANSWRLPKRYPLGEVGFLDTDFFKGRIQKALPPEVLGRPLTNVADAPARLVAAFGERATVGDVLALDLAALARKSGMTVKQVAEARAHLLRTHASAAPTRG